MGCDPARCGTRQGPTQRGAALLYKGPERRTGQDRRTAYLRLAAKRYALTPGLEQGWFVCESPRDKRRIMPIPPQWDARSDAELEQLCRSATPVRKITA